jgi:PcRGLX-like protein C-terminal alpha/alpha toroid domain/PcRGLX-like protein central beta sandwich domain/PcRGLX-like N-terminal RIFT barrel domain
MSINLAYIKQYFIIGMSLLVSVNMYAAETLRIKVEKSVDGAPLTLGIPFPQGVLDSPDHVRVVDLNGNEVPSQTTLVTTWEPLDFSVKWMWVFFFSTGDEDYIIEYGSDVRKAAIEGDRIKIKNAQRRGQSSFVETGPLRFTIGKRGGGFIDHVLLDRDRDGFDGNDTIAVVEGSRGSFLDLLDDLGIDSSKASVHRTFRERGSGPLHAIIRLEGDYTYDREDNRVSPFTIRIHLYAGKSYIRVYHTLTYIGVPDKHIPLPGQHANVAREDYSEIIDDSESSDLGWLEANDRIAGTGLSLTYNLKGEIVYRSGYKVGSWYDPGMSKIYDTQIGSNKLASCFQTGPKPDRIPPVPNSTLEERISGFGAEISIDGNAKIEVERAEGWADISDDRWGIGIGIKNFLEEYPKEIAFDIENNRAVTYLWSPQAGPMSFARSSLKRDQGMIANLAEGVTKTSEVVIYFHENKVSDADLKTTMDYFLDPPVPHAAPEVYSKSMVYGQFSPRQENNLEFERALDYKLGWELFNQNWEPWYGMFDYGDHMNMFFRENWYRWENNEPAIDYMLWLQFMRTGNPKYYKAAEAMSRHTMDVDNVHWPADPPYYGDTNESIDYWKTTREKSAASPYLGVGRRHANQHWAAILSAHVWVQGWLASYYLTGYHRGLDIAKLTGDSFLRRIWGDHGLTGRRLYLSVWNLVEVWDATKDPKYLEDLQDRVDIMLGLQNGSNQYDNLVIDRYGYSQVYASHGLYKYYQLTKDERVKQSLIRHARAVRDNPPYNHEYESLLATIHSLLLGYEFTGDKEFLDVAQMRAEVIKTGKLNKSFEQLGDQKKISDALKEVSNLPQKGDFQSKVRWSTNWNPEHGLRVFGWTHMYSIPWLLNWLREEE